MAFNPFHSFRKHQKAIFAALTILCMLTFVMCTGMGGDVGDWLLRVLGGREKSPQVAMLYDSKVTELELLQVKANRRMADEFMVQATALGRPAAQDKIMERFSEERKKQIANLLNYEMNAIRQAQ